MARQLQLAFEGGPVKQRKSKTAEPADYAKVRNLDRQAQDLSRREGIPLMEAYARLSAILNETVAPSFPTKYAVK